MRSFKTSVSICYDYFFFYNGTCDFWVQTSTKQKTCLKSLTKIRVKLVLQ